MSFTGAEAAFPKPVNKSSGALLFRGQSKVREGCFWCYMAIQRKVRIRSGRIARGGVNGREPGQEAV
jgi:hypothetical protein